MASKEYTVVHYEYAETVTIRQGSARHSNRPSERAAGPRPGDAAAAVREDAPTAPSRFGWAIPPRTRKRDWGRAVAMLGAMGFAAGALASSGPTYEAMILIALGGMGIYAVIAGRRRASAAKADLRRKAARPEEEGFDAAEALRAERVKPHSDDELAETARRIRTLKIAANGLADTELAPALMRLAFVAEGLLLQAATRTSAKRTLRRPLLHHLEHAEAVASNVLRMHEDGAAEAALLARAAATFDQLATDFEAHRRRASRDKALETEARLDLLTEELEAGAAAVPEAR